MLRRLSIPTIPEEGKQHISFAKELQKNLGKQNTLSSSIILGILGTSVVYNESHINQLIETIIQLWGKPVQLILQQTGQAAMFIESWAETNHIPIIPIHPEWSKYGPKACFHVNNKIEKEATHIVIIRSPRAKSDKMLIKAEQLSSKKCKPCLVLMDIQSDGSVVIDNYESSLQPSSKKKLNEMQDIRNMFLNASKI
jgi:hypothetical protein